MDFTKSGLLVVEDDASIAVLLERYVERLKCTPIFFAETAVKARAILAGSRSDLQFLVTDNTLPDGSGVDLAREFLNSGEGRVLLMSGLKPQMMNLSGLAGNDRFTFIEKPFGPVDFWETMESLGASLSTV